MSRKLILTPCPPSKQCPICIARIDHAIKFYGIEAIVPEELVAMEDMELAVTKRGQEIGVDN